MRARRRLLQKGEIGVYRISAPPDHRITLKADALSSATECVVSGACPFAGRPLPGVDLLEIEDVPKAAIDLAKQRQWCLAGLFGQICLVESDHRGDVHDRVFG